ncbi:SpoIIE family protein phosphatase [Streptomyces sp. CG1]|uniref:SpoIIE family protein phosphatase n=1 Tax=Streptomyces sp. CG1 TaxID=1287523 RepID=UPI0034E1B849
MRPGEGTFQRHGLMDVLSVAAVVLDSDGRIVFWSPQAEELFGYTAEEALGRYAARLLVHEEHFGLVIKLFAEVMGTGHSWAGSFPVRLKDGGTRVVEFRNMRLQDELGDTYALGICADHATLQRIETDLSLSQRLVSQSPIGLAVFDTDLRYTAVNPVLERIIGLPAADIIGRRPHEVLPLLETGVIESELRQVLDTGVPQLDHYTVGCSLADPDHEHAWSVSRYRLEDPGGRVLGVASSIVDVTERHRAEAAATRARERLALIADASARIGTTLDVDKIAHELAEVAAGELADIAAVDILESVLAFHRHTPDDSEPALFRALALAAVHTDEASRAADPPGELAAYGPDRLVTRCVHTGRPVLVPHVSDEDLRHIARDAETAALLHRAGVHSYLAVPLIARDEVIGALDLKRTINPLPFDQDDVVLAGELAARAAMAIDNARWFEGVRNTAVTLQRSLLPEHPRDLVGLEVASRYEPAQAASEVGGDWYDVIPLADHTTVLVVGDVMGNGIDAAATMGRLRTATCTLAELDFDPAQVLQHLDRITRGLEQYIATCVYAVYDPHGPECHIANAGHLPPVLVHRGKSPQLLDLPTGVPLGVGGIPFHSTTLDLEPGDLLVLYTDGLVETRDDPIDERLGLLLALLDGSDRRPVEETCDLLLDTLRAPHTHDDVALLIARSQHKRVCTDR